MNMKPLTSKLLKTPKLAQFNAEKTEWEAFGNAVKQNHLTRSHVLREFIKDYIERQSSERR